VMRTNYTLTAALLLLLLGACAVRPVELSTKDRELIELERQVNELRRHLELDREQHPDTDPDAGRINRVKTVL
jgi:hypothetical protein